MSRNLHKGYFHDFYEDSSIITSTTLDEMTVVAPQNNCQDWENEMPEVWVCYTLSILYLENHSILGIPDFLFELCVRMIWPPVVQITRP